MKKEPLQGLSKLIKTQSKKSILIFLFFLFSSITGFSQRTYSTQNLEQASLEELNVYLKTSRQLNKRGAIMSIAGPVAFLSGAGLMTAAWDSDNSALTYISLGLGLAGMATTIVGLPTLITNSIRVDKITRIMEAKSVTFEIVPCRFHTLNIRSTQSGISLRFQF